MTYSEYLGYIAEAEHASAETLLAQYGFPADCPWGAETLVKVFEIIKAVADNDIKAIVGDNVTRTAEYYGIPYRTMLKWVSGERSAPDYVIKMLGYAIISELPRECT